MSEPALGGLIQIGNDLKVPRLGFGAMQFCGPGAWGEQPDRHNAVTVLRAARHAGVRLFDTAWAYGPELNESLVADALYPYEDSVIATKTGLENDGNGRLYPNGRPSRIREMTEGSLRRLKVEAIDLLQLHAPDANVAFEDSIGALAELQSEGKARHIGLSSVTVEQLDIAAGIVDVVAVQNHYNVTHTTEHEEVLQACEDRNIAFLAYRPIAGAELESKQALVQVAERLGASSTQVALAWLLQRSPVTVPIPGTTKLSHLHDNLAAGSLLLSPDDIEELEG